MSNDSFLENITGQRLIRRGQSIVYDDANEERQRLPSEVQNVYKSKFMNKFAGQIAKNIQAAKDHSIIEAAKVKRQNTASGVGDR